MIQNVYRKKRTKNGKTTIDRNYRGRYRLDGDLKTEDIPLNTSDKQVAEQLLRDIVHEKQMERAGLLAPKKERVAAEQPLAEHLRDFLNDLEALGRSTVYRRLIRTRNGRIFKECSWRFAKDINSDCFVAWRATQKDLSPKTLNEYLNAANTLLNWLVRHGRISSNPLSHVGKIEIRGRQQKRRALTTDELNRLLEVSEDRRLLYLTACYTGLRQNELKQLMWGDVHFGSKAFIKARASTTKNGKEAVIPLHPNLTSEFQSYKPADVDQGTKVFGIDSNPDRAFVRDLKNANIVRVDALNRKVDFHALRYTFCTMLAKNGTSQRMAQELMRHSDPHLTAQIYTDVSQLPTFNAVSDLPWYNEHSEKETTVVRENPAHTLCPKLSKIFRAWNHLPEDAQNTISAMVDALSPDLD